LAVRLQAAGAGAPRTSSSNSRCAADWPLECGPELARGVVEPRRELGRAEARHGHFKRRGWKLRPQREVTAARSYKHGRKPRAQRQQQNAYRRWLA
jgi:hypothetical protein